MSDIPRVSCVLTCHGASVVVDVTIERPLNGFYGCTMRYDLDWTPNKKKEADLTKLDADVRTRVAWKVGMETGLHEAWPKSNIHLQRA